MSKKAHGQLRRGQVITTYGPGALIDLPRHSAIVGGLDTWPSVTNLEAIDEPRLAAKLQAMTQMEQLPRLFAPPPEAAAPDEPNLGIGAWLFPEWFVVQDAGRRDGSGRSRRLVHRKALDNGGKSAPGKGLRYQNQPVVATRFVRACTRGHVDELHWHAYAHGPKRACSGLAELWLDERGTSSDLVDLWVRCGACGAARSLLEATRTDGRPLGTCTGRRPWLGQYTNEDCELASRLLIRTASNAYFPQVLSVLSLPDHRSDLEHVVAELWDDLSIVEDAHDLAFIKRKPGVAERLAPFVEDDVLAAIKHRRKGGPAADRPVKQVELDALLAVPEGYGDDVPIDPDFHARRLPESVWRRSGATDNLAAVVQVHRLREVMALLGFTRFEAVTPDIDGEYDTDVERAAIAEEPSWFPAVENRGEGIFLQLRADAVAAWLARPAVEARAAGLGRGHDRWASKRKSSKPFAGAPYVLLHTLSHMLIQSLAMRCGYSASAIRERIYVDNDGGRYGILLYTASPDAEGTLGGLVQQARDIALHLRHALRSGALCSNDPICALHDPATSYEERLLHGAACHGCALVAEPSCEMRNDYLDRALVVPVLGTEDAAFFAIDG